MNERDFREAVDQVGNLPDPPPNVRLNLYGLYKQATSGDANGSRPGILSIRDRVKFDAWAARRGMDRDLAMDSYVAYVERLRKEQTDLC